MNIPSGTYVAQCRRCGGVVGVAGEDRFHDYMAIWRFMDVMVHRHDGVEVEMETGHSDACPNRLFVESTPSDRLNVWHEILFSKEIPSEVPTP